MTRGCEPAVWLPTIRAGTGADVFTKWLCEGLNTKGIRAEIAWLPHRAEYLPWTVSVVRPPAWANVVHVNSWLPQRFWPKRLPIVVTVHHLVHDPAFRPYRSVLQAAYHELLIRNRELHAILDADAVTTVSDYVRRTVTAFSGRDQITVIHNWVDSEKFSPGFVASTRGDAPFRLFMAGSHSKRKGADLLAAFSKALGSGFEIRYAGGRRSAVTTVAGVTELGKISDDELVHEYRTCNAVVSLSRYEGFGYTALEAMACGKPFFGFETSALPEVVAPDSGILVPVDDVDALANAVHTLYAREKAGRIVDDAGRKRALEHFGKGNMSKYIEIYSSLITR